MATPVTVSLRTRPSVQRDASPITSILVVPKEEIVAGAANVTIGAPDNTLTEITASNLTAQLASSGLVRSAYNHIEALSASRLFVLPFTVDTNDGISARLTKVVAAINRTQQASEKAKLPLRGADLMIVPREAGLGTSAANPVFAAVAAACGVTQLGAIGLVDAGPYADNPASTEPSQTNVLQWVANNKNGNVMSVTNRGNVAGFDAMYGSVLAAAHIAYYTGLYNLAHSPFNLLDQLRGVSNFVPVRDFDPFDVSAANTLANSPNFLTSLITEDGSGYLWGGHTGESDENSPLLDVINHLVANRIYKQARQDLTRFVRRRATERLLSQVQVNIQNDLSATYVAPGLVADIDVGNVTLAGGHAEVVVDVQFFDILDTVSLTVEVYI